MVLEQKVHAPKTAAIRPKMFGLFRRFSLTLRCKIYCVLPS